MNWADHFNTYEEFCYWAGVDTPAQIMAEIAAQDAEDCIAVQDAMEARGGPLPGFFSTTYEEDWLF